MNLTNLNRRKFILFVTILIFLFLGFLLWVFESTTKETKQKKIDSSKPYNNYTNINLLKPGETTEAEVYKLLGNPKSISWENDQKYLNFETPFEYFTNYVVIKDGVVNHVLENVFSDYRGDLGESRERYGQEALTLYSRLDEDTWYVFLENGVAVNVLGEIRKVFYFIPQNEESFISNFKEELDFTKEKPFEEEEIILEPG